MWFRKKTHEHEYWKYVKTIQYKEADIKVVLCKTEECNSYSTEFTDQSNRTTYYGEKPYKSFRDGDAQHDVSVVKADLYTKKLNYFKRLISKKQDMQELKDLVESTEQKRAHYFFCDNCGVKQ